jgi:hypothetical protein
MNIPKLTNPESLSSCVEFIQELTRQIGIGFHPDTPFDDYVDVNGCWCFTVPDADRLQSELNVALETLDLFNVDPCEVAFEIQRQLINAL